MARQLRDQDVRLPSGRTLTVEAFQFLGNLLGSSVGSRQLHYLLEAPFTGQKRLSDAFLLQVEAQLSWASANPLFFVLHEASYAQGAGATRWSAQRIRAEHPEFDALAALESDAPVLFTGEMIYPWMFDNDPLLRPLRAVADEIADRPGWPDLYDIGRLEANSVPVTAAVYVNDMYVNRELSLAAAGLIRGLRHWLTDEYEHDGLRVSNGAVLNHLIEIAHAK